MSYTVSTKKEKVAREAPKFDTIESISKPTEIQRKKTVSFGHKGGSLALFVNVRNSYVAGGKKGKQSQYTTEWHRSSKKE